MNRNKWKKKKKQIHPFHESKTRPVNKELSNPHQGWAPAAAGTCGGEGMTGEAVMLAKGWDDEMDVTPPIQQNGLELNMTV